MLSRTEHLVHLMQDKGSPAPPLSSPVALNCLGTISALLHIAVVLGSIYDMDFEGRYWRNVVRDALAGIELMSFLWALLATFSIAFSAIAFWQGVQISRDSTRRGGVPIQVVSGALVVTNGLFLALDLSVPFF